MPDRGQFSAEYTFVSNFVEGRPFLFHHEFSEKIVQWSDEIG